LISLWEQQVLLHYFQRAEAARRQEFDVPGPRSASFARNTQHSLTGSEFRSEQEKDMRNARILPIAIGAAFVAAACLAILSKPEAIQGETHMTIQEVKVQRLNIISTEPFETVVARIDAAIGHPDMVAFYKSLSAAKNEAEMEKVVNPVTQPNGLMEFARFDVGQVLQKENGTAKPRILRVVAGNPLIMKEMVKHVVDAASYAPVTILIEERPDSVRISYDRMASYLAPYGNSDALKVARELDAKVERILTAAAQG
jgi:uncharacterized protein (DUF302 family)